LVRPHGLGLPTGPGQRHQQVADEPLAQRVRGHHVRQLADHLVVAAQLELEREALLDRREALLVQLRGGRRHDAPGQAEQRRPAPQLERGGEPGGGRLGVAVPGEPASGGHLGREGLGVERAGGRPHAVARPVGVDDRLARTGVGERAPQRGDDVLDLAARGVGRQIVPDRVDEVVDGDQSGCVGQQHREQYARSRSPDHQPLPADRRLERPENAEGNTVRPGRIDH